MSLETEAAACHLRHLGLLRFSGPEAAQFLQGQVSNDTAALAGGAPLLAAYSTAQGRVLAVMHLLPHSSGILAVLPAELAAPTLERLRKFVLRTKVKIEDLSDRWRVAGVGAAALGAAAAEPPPASRCLEQNGFAVARVLPQTLPASGPERYWLVGEAAGGAPAQAGEAPAQDGAALQRAELAWRLADIRDGLPQVYAATAEAFVAQMLNLDLVGGISFTKGCYTGQEIIARTQHLGRIKRRLSRLRLPPGDWSIGRQLRLADGRSGRLTEVAPAGDAFEALAVLTLDAVGDAETQAIEAVAAEELPLPYPRG